VVTQPSLWLNDWGKKVHVNRYWTFLNIVQALKWRVLSSGFILVHKLCLPPAFTLVSCSAYSSTLKMEAICSSETSVDFQRTTRRYIPEDSNIYNHRCENLKSYKHEHVLKSCYLNVLSLYANNLNVAEWGVLGCTVCCQGIRRLKKFGNHCSRHSFW
jgi:hypothetical protein